MIRCNSEFRALSTHQADLMKKQSYPLVYIIFTISGKNNIKTIGNYGVIFTIGEKGVTFR